MCLRYTNYTDIDSIKQINVHAGGRFLYGERSIVEVFWAENTENRAFLATFNKANTQNRGGHIYT